MLSMQDNNAVFDGEEQHDDETELYTRRDALKLGAATAAVVATSGTALAETDTDADDDLGINFDSDYAHDPYVKAVATVEGHEPGYGSLDYLADDETRADLGADGFVVAPKPDDVSEPTAWNPVTLKASDLYALNDDGNRTPHAEFGAFPRGVTYDHDADGSTAEEPVSVLDAEHWSASGATVADAANGALQIEGSGVASGSTVTATFDLAAVGSEDATIGSISRKFLQFVADVDVLTAGATVEVAVVDSAGASVAAKWVAGGDSSQVDVVGTSTGDAQVGQVRVGELENDASVDLADAQQVEVRIKDADATVVFHGINLERATEWTFGQQEQTATEDGDTVVETVDVVNPSGSFGITSLATLDDTPFSNAGIAAVTYDAQQRASELPDSAIMARLKDAPDAYDRPKELEVFYQFEAPSAYAVDVEYENVEDVVVFPSTRYTDAGIATGITEPESWDDVEGITWTDTQDQYSSVGATRELLATVSAADVTGYTVSHVLDEDEAELLTSAAGSAVAVGATGGGGGGNGVLTAALALFGTLAVVFRNHIRGALAAFGGAK